MELNYKKELENASKSMILIHNPSVLMKLIVRMIIRRVHVQHAGILLYDEKKDSYILSISQGEMGLKIPVGFLRLDKDNPIIKLFTRKEFKIIPPNRGALVSNDIETMIWRESMINNVNKQEIKQILHDVSNQMRMFSAVCCIPAYFQDNLLALLLLGEKEDGEKFQQDELDFFSALASDVAMAIRNAQLFNGLKKESERNKKLLLNITISLATAIEAKDKYTHGHTDRVTGIALLVANQMVLNGSLEPKLRFFENLHIAGLLHDIGKIAIPEQILNKPDRLTDEEFEIVKKHPVKGAEILKSIPEFDESLKGVRYHHERYDGKGYPEGLRGDHIPIIAAIISVADAFDAMTTDRPYRKSLTKDEALFEIKSYSSTQFHPLVVEAFIQLFEAGKV